MKIRRSSKMIQKTNKIRTSRRLMILWIWSCKFKTINQRIKSQIHSTYHSLVRWIKVSLGQFCQSPLVANRIISLRTRWHLYCNHKISWISNSLAWQICFSRNSNNKVIIIWLTKTKIKIWSWPWNKRHIVRISS